MRAWIEEVTKKSFNLLRTLFHDKSGPVSKTQGKKHFFVWPSTPKNTQIKKKIMYGYSKIYVFHLFVNKKTL